MLIIISTFIATFVNSKIMNKTETFLNKTLTKHRVDFMEDYDNKTDELRAFTTNIINETEISVNKTIAKHKVDFKKYYDNNKRNFRIPSNEDETFINNMFAIYQVDFKKHYDNKSDEERALNNFVENFAEINELNAKLVNDTNHTKVYVFNKYTDENREEIDEHYGIKLIPHNEVNGKEMSGEETDNTRSIKDAQLHDLYNTDQLYEEYQKKFKKENVTSERVKAIRYYRFVKTLVEINQNNIEGKELRILDDQADIVQKPLEYYH